MHELPFVMRLLEEAGEAARAQGLARITELKVRVGAMSGIEPECVRLYFETASEGTPAEGASLLIETEPARLICADCLHAFPFVPSGGEEDYDPFRCPACGGEGVLDRKSAGKAELISLKGREEQE